MSERRYRSGLEGVPGHVAAGKLLNRNLGSHRAAWNDLEIFDLDTAHDYMDSQAKAALDRGSESEQINSICEVATMFAMTAVMADRECRREEEEEKHRTRVKRLKEAHSGDAPTNRQAG